ncbi:ankyrin repeat domain-containing protein [Candidatus Avelusimicrobium luingense]|uniref:ankyrin repeat domain-containing protein n=1 Tax=Candidatus Avelusimicrobium luingense TaxID=3416211 RepID=UPI003D11347A
MNKNFTIFLVVVVLLFGGGFYYRYKTNAADERGATKLMRSFEQETEQQKVLRMIRHADNLNERDKTGRTALFYAVQHNADPEMIEHLIKQGADTTITDSIGQTVLMVAARYNMSEPVLGHLLSAGAPINAADRDGYTALAIAAQFNTPGMVKKLLRAGADPDIKPADGQNIADILAKNEKFSDTEKEDYALALKVLSIIGPRPRIATEKEK